MIFPSEIHPHGTDQAETTARASAIKSQPYEPDMKSKHHLKLIALPHLAFAIATASAGTTETVAPAPAAPTGCLDWIKVSGYAAIAYTNTDDNAIGETFADGNTPFDAVKVGFTGTQGPFGGYVSLFYTPDVPGEDAGILDAYATYTAGGFTITGGKYLSYLGYEAFDTVNMNQLTYATGIGAIPAYHTGVKVDYATDTFGAGFSVSDSITGGDGFWSGDDEFGDDQGYEGYITYKGIDKLTLWAGFGYENTDNSQDWITYDFWASYALTEKLTVAGELAYHEDPGVEGIQGLLFGQYAFTEKFSGVARFGIAERANDAGDDYSYTIAPTYKFCENFLARAELTYNDKAEDQDFVFYGVQALAKF